MLILQYKTGAGTIPGSVTIANTTYDNKSFALGTSANYNSLILGDEGSKMYVMATSYGGQHWVDGIRQYSLSTPWDISTASYDNKLLNTNADDAGGSVGMVSGDGLLAYMNGPNFVSLHQYAMFPAWDISTAAATGSPSETVIGFGGQEMTFNSDGSKFYLLDNGVVKEYGSANYNTIGATATGKTYTPTESGISSTGVQISHDSSRMWVSNGNTMYEYDMGTVGDISTSSYSGTSYTFPGLSGLVSSRFSDDYSKIYVLSNTSDTVYQYSVN